VLFVAMPEFFRMLGRHTGLGTDRSAVATDGGSSTEPDTEGMTTTEHGTASADGEDGAGHERTDESGRDRGGDR